MREGRVGGEGEGRGGEGEGDSGIASYTYS